MINSRYKVILASQSPRRQELLKGLGIEFETKTKEGIEEIYPEGLSDEEVAIYLAELKAKAFKSELIDNTIVITADTIVCINGKVVNKPTDRDDAIRMITELSGNKHQVITGVCVSTNEKSISFNAKTDVYFANLSQEEVEYYVDTFKPYDKAGAYGIQEWIGYIGIEKIEGSYFNVMGLPTQRLYEVLKNFKN